MFGERLRKIREIRGLKQNELADLSGISKQSISVYERTEENNIKSETIKKLAKALDTTPNYLMGLADFYNLEMFDLNERETIDVPIYGRIPAGVPIEALQVDYGHVGVDADKFRGNKRFIGLKVKGNSMYPYYMDGDVVILELTTDAKSGDDVVAYIGYDHEATLKRYHIKEDHIELEPLNREYPIKKYYEHDVPVRVLGVVRELRRDVS